MIDEADRASVAWSTVLVLVIDTSTPVVTAGVVRVLRPHEVMASVGATGSDSAADPAAAMPSPVTCLAERTLTDPFGHAEHLMPLVGEALAAAGRALGEADAVVVGLGPGPFTGLRVGIATAQALGDARSLPVYGVPSHDGVALAVAAGMTPGPGDGGPPDGAAAASRSGFLVVTDARRREVYVSGYRDGTRRIGPSVAAPADVAGLLPAGLEPAWIAGAGAVLVAPALGLPVRQPARPATEGLARAAVRPLLTGAIPGPLTPLYLRRPDATVPGAPKQVLPAGDPSVERR
jgi:tRNA threonylcarbamoyl adenosine modification protein YeaZ